MSTRARVAGAGFTLIEVLVVLALLGLALAVVVPRVGKSDALAHEAQVRGAATLFRGARATALESGSVRYVDVDFDRRLVRHDGREVRFGNDVAMRATLAERDVAQGGRARFTFFPDGSARGGALVLSRLGRVRAIEVDWLSGRVRLRDAPAEPSSG